jgi:peptide/nickel transport system substrate-binding protein
MQHRDVLRSLVDELSRGRLSRRDFMYRCAALGLSASASAAMVKAAEAARFQTDEEPVSGGTFSYGSGILTNPVISPVQTTGTSQNVIIEAVFLRLLYGQQWGDGLNPDPDAPLYELAVAESMTEIEPNQIWEFTLRENVLWHDGVPVTADDLIFGVWLSLNKDAGTFSETPPIALKGGARLREEGGGSATPPYTVEVEGITKLGDHAVRIELERPIPNYWVNWGVGYWPMPKHIFGEMPLADLFNEPYATMPVGNGPFKVVQYVDRQFIEMDANEDFFLGRPLLDKLIIRFGESDTTIAALEAEEIQGSGVSIGPVFDRLSELPHIVTNAVPRNHPDGFLVNRARFPQSGEIHKAIMHAIDVPTINEQLYSGTLRPSNYLFEHVVGLEQPPDGFITYDYDPEAARAILDGIGWDPNQTLEWVLTAEPTPAFNAMQAMLSQVGINTTFRIIDSAAQNDILLVAMDYDIIFRNFGADQLGGNNHMYFKCGFTWEEGGYNQSSYCNEEVDALWAEADAATDLETIQELFSQITLLLQEDPPLAMLWRQSIGYGWNERVRGAYPYQYRLPVRPAWERVWLAPEA